MAADESRAPRHGKHAAGRHAASPAPVKHTKASAPQPAAQTSAPQQAAPIPQPLAMADEPIAEVVSIIDGDQETRMGDAPRPIGVDPSESGSFQRITAADGARVTTRINASETASFRLENSRPMEAVRMSSAGRPKVERHEVAVQPNKRVFIILGIAAAVVLLVVGTLLTRALISVEPADDGTGVQVEQTQASGDEGIEYRGSTYAVTQQEGGAYALTSLSEGSSTPAVLHELAGTPVTLILYNTVFIIPENLGDDTWDLIAYPLGGGSVAQQVTDGSGNPVVGKGQIAEAKLVGDAVEVTTTSGEKQSVSLV